MAIHASLHASLHACAALAGVLFCIASGVHPEPGAEDQLSAHAQLVCIAPGKDSVQLLVGQAEGWLTAG